MVCLLGTVQAFRAVIRAKPMSHVFQDANPSPRIYVCLEGIPMENWEERRLEILNG